MSLKWTTSRRTILKASGLLPTLALPAIWTSSTRAQTSQITVRDPGGDWREALSKAYYEPFEAETGIRVNAVLAEHDPTAQIKSQVDTGNYLWDVAVLTMAAHAVLPPETYFEALDLAGPDVAELIPQARQETWMGNSVYAMVLAYSVEKYGANPPSGWADMWNTEAFPGRRALRRHAIDTFEAALLADGVEPGNVFPIDIDRALKSLDKIKTGVDVWWTGGAQSSQLLKSGEVDLCAAWNARAQSAIDDGANYALSWNQGIWGIDGWCVLKGAPQAGTGREFVKFCANAERQAIFSKHLAYGPVNPKAFEVIDADRAKLLPTNPEYFDNLVLQDPVGWGPVKDEALERFEAWIIS